MVNDGLKAVSEVGAMTAEQVLALVLVDARTGLDAVATLMDLSVNEDHGERAAEFLEAARDLVGSLSKHFHGKPDHEISPATRAAMVDAGLLPEGA